MAMLKCKMCGGNLEVSEGVTVCECEYCGTNQTVPKAQDDVTANLFNRANNLRIKCEFDKAQEIYEKIVSANPNESEAYWGIVLCKFGIEYVEDPVTFKKIPTCHRTQFESVQTDVDYKAAIENADMVQRSLYESEAAEIDRLQRDILAIVHNEDPFDVFICYKETDENGRRTNDSVIANDIYHQLTQEGFKVFYAAITLEDKLGQEYEPYIFAALTSAKVMLAIGSKPEYFNAVWVKNEWSRYLKIMKNDRSKLLIPCYKDMDAYDLPEEFSHLQAQDMSKIGFINDVIRGIKKVIVKEEAPVVQQTVVNNVSAPASSNVENLLKRGFLSLEDRKWEEANKFFEQVLNENVEEARAYLGKLMASFMASRETDLALPRSNGIESDYYKKALRFGSQELKTKLTEYNNHSIYRYACEKMSSANTQSDYLMSKEAFDKILSYKDSAQRSAECVTKSKDCVYNEAVAAMEKAADKGAFLLAKELFDKILGHRDSAEKSKECDIEAKNCVYSEAVARLENSMDKDGCLKAKEMFDSISGYRDSAEKSKECEYKAKDCVYNEASSRLENANDKNGCMKAKEMFDSIPDYKDAAQKSSECEKKPVYIDGMSIMNNAKDDEAFLNAAEMLFQIPDYQDAAQKAEECIDTIYRRAVSLDHNNEIKNAENWEEAYSLLLMIEKYKDVTNEKNELSNKIDAYEKYKKNYDYVINQSEIRSKECSLTEEMKANIKYILSVLIPGIFIIVCGIILPFGKAFFIGMGGLCILGVICKFKEYFSNHKEYKKNIQLIEKINKAPSFDNYLTNIYPNEKNNSTK